MSHPLVEHSVDLQQLRGDGYALSVRNDHLVITNIPFVTAEREIVYGALISDGLHAQGNQTLKPNSHVVIATHLPHDAQGNKLTPLIMSEQNEEIVPGLPSVCRLSNTPNGKEPDTYHENFTHYIDLIVPHARAIDPAVTARVTNPVDSSTYNVFHYIDTNTSKARIGKYASLLETQTIAIVGLGGTGSYILDLVAKTPVRAIHLYDDDVFSNHNAFRSPGAASLAELDEAPSKVDYQAKQYGKMHKVIHAHKSRVDTSNVDELSNCDFVFLCVDDAASRHLIANFLANKGVPFVDTGISVEAGALGLTGASRVTAVYPPDTNLGLDKLPASSSTHDLYESNIQVADINMLNAAHAVIAWKQWSKFYYSSNSCTELVANIDAGMNMLS
jgi:hypothetical protein